MIDTTKEHIPVMLNEVMGYLSPKEGGVYIDCTFGTGGYSRAILKKKPASLYAIDQDPDVFQFVEKLKSELSDKAGAFHFIHGNFANIEELLHIRKIDLVDGIVLDLGISSIQVDRKERGFSFQKEGRLDMRMSQEGYSAYDFINESDENTISKIIYLYGDEKRSRKIARNIVEKRSVAPIETTTQLADIIREVCVDRSYHKKRIDSATKTFQAIRIFINKEMEALESILASAEKLLKDQGRLVVVSFHSTEDRIVKNFLAKRSSRGNQQSRYFIDFSKYKEFIPTFKLLSKKVVTPSKEEVEHNIRARSAKLRGAIRVRKGEYAH